MRPTACRSCISNCSNNYGPFHFPEKLIPLTILNALEEKPLPVYGNGANVRDWLFVEDHARALELVATEGMPGQSYNVGGRCERSNLSVVETICDTLDQMKPRHGGGSYRELIAFVPDRPGHDRRYAIDASKIERELGWRPAETFESGLAKTVRWYIENDWWWKPIRDGTICRRAAGVAGKSGIVKILVTGREGQVARSLAERAAGHPAIDLVTASRPELDLVDPETVMSAITAAKPDIVVSAAAYTAVDQAEDEPERAHAINALGAGAVAAAAASVGAAVIHLSTDYVFSGDKEGEYRETDQPDPQGVYGRTKLEGERAVAAANPRHVILRTAWVYSPFGRNFVKTMLGLAGQRDSIRVVADQWGNPTSALDIADGILRIAETIESRDRADRFGIFHLAGAGSTNWSGLAKQVFAESRLHGGPFAQVEEIATEDYPTRARRPRNSRLCCEKLWDVYGWRAPDWRVSCRAVVERLVKG